MTQPSPAPDPSGAGLDDLERHSSDTPYPFSAGDGDGRIEAAPSADSTSALTSAIESFLFHCRFEKNLSPKTLNAYELDLRQFTTSLAAGGQTPLREIGKPQLRGYIQQLFDTLAVKSIKRKVATLKAFFHYLEREDLVVASPFRKMEVRIREPHRLPRTLSLAELESILSAAYRELVSHQQDGGGAPDAVVRDIALLELLFATGARVSELCNLRCESVDLLQGTVRILGKGRRERVIHIGDEEVLGSLRRYQDLVLGAVLPDAPFFQNRWGRRLSEQSVRTILRKRVASAGLTIRVTPHLFRHSVATLLLEEGVDIRFIQQFLGHSSIATTQIYTHVHDSAQKRIIAAQHPRRRIRGAPV